MKIRKSTTSTITAIVLALTVSACSGTTELLSGKEKESGPRPHDPNDVVTQTGSSEDKEAVAANAATKGATTQLSARTTLLEDNEHLRDELAKAIALRRLTEEKLGNSESQCRELTEQTQRLKDSVAQLSEELEGKTKQIEELEGKKTRLEKDRATLAQMFALEKRQRLAFEKELLEREIGDRTRTKDG